MEKIITSVGGEDVGNAIAQKLNLPEAFLTRIQRLLPPHEFSEFIQSYDKPPMRGLRFNMLKFPSKGEEASSTASYREFAALGDIPLAPVPWCPTGFTYPTDARPGKSLAYHAGLFYIQEPSAMCPAELLAPCPGERVLDLCAAPGGKSVQIAGHLQNCGLLIANDASPTRSRALVKNLELAGVTNAIVLNEKPNRLAAHFAGFFDKILVDAPCSGEGMFRRDPEVAKAYAANKPEVCAAMQRDILLHAAKMLKPGGRLVYSTCTFNTIENEDIIEEFLRTHENSARGEFELIEIKRIWPHTHPGEGHFAALLEKKADLAIVGELAGGDRGGRKGKKPIGNFSSGDFADFKAFCREGLVAGVFENIRGDAMYGEFVVHGASLYLQPEAVDLAGLRVSRSGWYLGDFAKGRFVPSQALAMGIKSSHAKFTTDLSDSEAQKYLHGESPNFSEPITSDAPIKPWVLITHNNHPLGWARLTQGRLKNHLHKGWHMRS